MNPSPLAPSSTVLVTGGTGFVAGWCIAELLRRGYTVRTTVRSLSKEAGVRASVASVVAGADDRLSFHVADLTSDSGWDAAVAGCDYVLHVASPLGNDSPSGTDALLAPARDGTLRVLRAATRAGVKRVVMTSSLAAATPSRSDEGNVADENVWTDLNDTGKTNAYRMSKAVAERAAWDFMKDHGGKTTLSTVLPGAVFGPLMGSQNLGSVLVIGRILGGKLPGNPRIGFSIVDVRDLADLHVRAMTAPEAAGQRFIAIRDFMWMADIAGELRARLGEQARKVPTRTLPDFVLRLAAVFDKALHNVTPLLGRKLSFSSAKAQQVLGWAPRPAKATVVDCARSLIEAGVVA
ncbi:UNVERIFIED_ORG: nucleoside-diphosphate-sugar epimerase [Variovorax paradoxus]|nr:nucleoside-diphosphate-sugar epimerase [Variovorax paradoxus]